MRRISGVDVNGWMDLAARDWDPDRHGDEETREIRIVHGGIGSVAVQTGSGVQYSDRWMGGPQALLAPHGRGNGWGELGAKERRMSLVQVWKDLGSPAPPQCSTPLAAATRALARGAEELIFAVPDVPDCDEAVQGRILDTLNRNFRTCRLLWRPVAAFLGALEQGHIPKDADGASFRLLIHTGEGIDVQTLRVRRDHNGHVAPERAGYGFRILPDLGLRRLQELAHHRVLDVNPRLQEMFGENSNMALKILFSTCPDGETEILRLDNGVWLEVTAPTLGVADFFTGADFQLERKPEPVAASFIVTPLSANFASALVDNLTGLIPNLRPLGWDLIARGSLHAGRIIERGLPHYFDRLTSIGLAVRKESGPTFDDLVNSNATLPANKEYQSPPHRNHKWPAGKRDIEFYVLKGGSEIRHWVVHAPDAPLHDTAVELTLRQTPGQSWAKLSVTSPDWDTLQRNPIFLEWSTLTPLDVSPEEILQQLRTPPPIIPRRVVEGPEIEFWKGGGHTPIGIIAALTEMKSRETFVPAELAQLLQRSRRDPFTRVRVRPIGTDGDLPDGLSEEVVDLLRQALSECEREINEATPNHPLLDNGALKSLTWSFLRCPPSIQDEMVTALEADLHHSGHKLLSPFAARRVLTQGAGRAIEGEVRLRRVLSVLTARKRNNDTLNALAMILSRREEAAQSLTPDLVRGIVLIVSTELEELANKSEFRRRFVNTLSAIAGLFRYREIEPYALLAERDPAARLLRDRIDHIDALITQRAEQIPLLQEVRTLLASIRDYLDGAGDPNILIRIESLDEDE